MSVTDGPDTAEAATDAADPGMYLPNLIRDAVGDRGAQWLADNAIDPDTGRKVFSSRQVAWTLMTKPKRAFLDPDQFRALCYLFQWEPEFLLQACTITLGITIPHRAGGLFSAMIPAGVDDLPIRRLFLYRDLLRAAVEDNAGRHE